MRITNERIKFETCLEHSISELENLATLGDEGWNLLPLGDGYSEYCSYSCDKEAEFVINLWNPSLVVSLDGPAMNLVVTGVRQTRTAGEKSIQLGEFRTPEEILSEAKLLLAQFISCSHDGKLDIENPENTGCDGCWEERRIIMDLIRDYGDAITTTG